MNLIVRIGAVGLCLPPARPALRARTTAGKLTIGGYGEVHYSNSTGPDTPGLVNVKRFVIYAGYAFNERITLHSELELEDTRIEGGESGGEVALEQAYLDYRFSNAFTLRTGLLLPPIGIINETHEPPSFNGVERPDFDNDVIPTTWRDIGVGAVGQIPGVNGLSYRVFLVNGLKAEGFTRRGRAFVRGGRRAEEASFANPSFTGRVEYAPGGSQGRRFVLVWWHGQPGSRTRHRRIRRARSGGHRVMPAMTTAPSCCARWEATIEVYDADKINAVYGLGRRPTDRRWLRRGRLQSAPAPALRNRASASTHLCATITTIPRPRRLPGTPDDATLARRITTFGLIVQAALECRLQGRLPVTPTTRPE